MTLSSPDRQEAEAIKPAITITIMAGAGWADGGHSHMHFQEILGFPVREKGNVKQVQLPQSGLVLRTTRVKARAQIYLSNLFRLCPRNCEPVRYY